MGAAPALPPVALLGADLPAGLGAGAGVPGVAVALAAARPVLVFSTSPALTVAGGMTGVLTEVLLTF